MHMDKFRCQMTIQRYFQSNNVTSTSEPNICIRESCEPAPNGWDTVGVTSACLCSHVRYSIGYNNNV
jgi:hypothetical protein